MLNNQSFNMMKALQEAEEMEIKKKVIVDSYHEELIESVNLEENQIDDVREDSIEKGLTSEGEECIKEDENTDKEERLASLKTQLEVDGAQLSDDEKAAIQEEIAQLENELNECDTKIEENVNIDINSETGDVEVTTDEGENVEVVDETEEPDESTDEEVTDEEVTDEIIDEPIEESKEIVTEQEVTNLREVKNQGNIFMLQDDSKFIVGENYNEAEALIENAEIYENKDEANKDYLSRCEITKDGKPAKLEESEEKSKEDLAE